MEIPPSPLLERIKEQGNLFLARFLEVETGRYPDNVDALAESVACHRETRWEHEPAQPDS